MSSDRLQVMRGRTAPAFTPAPNTRPPTPEELGDQTAKADTRKYVGNVASGYNAKREQSEKWLHENAIIESMLSTLPRGTSILDVPVGTGRFFDIYRKFGFVVEGLDVSTDMLKEAEKNIRDDDQIVLGEGSVLNLPCRDKSFDVAIMCRLSRWLQPVDCMVAFRELQRVSKGGVIWTARVRDHPHARPYTIWEEALHKGWRISGDIGLPGDPSYRIICAEPDDVVA